MDSRERFHALMNYQSVDHGVFVLPWFGFPATLANWRRQGYRDGDFTHYPLDQWHWLANWYFPHPPFQREVLEQTERHIVYVNHEGILIREMKNDPMGSMPQFLRFPVETRADFRKFARERLQPDIGIRIGDDWVRRLRELRSQPAVFWLVADRWGGFFGPLRNLLGVENLCTTLYTDPAIIEEMMDAIADYLIAMTDRILDHIEIDVFSFWEDMAHNGGPFISPELVRRYMLPRYKRVVDHLRSRGVRWISLDSDGNMESLIPIWLEAGINIIYPFEVGAGMDVVSARREYGKDLRMYMGIDKRILTQGPEAIDSELDYLRPLIEQGGYIPSIDHSVPPDVPYAHFQYYMEALSETLGITSPSTT